MLSILQKDTAQAIVNVFETGKLRGDYGQVTLLPGDTGHLTYGRSQTTLSSGNLHLLINDYCQASNSLYGDSLSYYIARLYNKDLSLDHDLHFKQILQDAGEDSVMHKIQDEFFDRVYWEPCLKSADYIAAKTGLGIGIIYDSKIHGSWHRIRDRTNDLFGQLSDLGESQWFRHYVETRLKWLSHHENALLHKTVYRMENFQTIINQENWSLALPLTVHGVHISKDTLHPRPVVHVSAEDPNDRNLVLTEPYLHGPDVVQIQQALNDTGIPLKRDGIYGPVSAQAVKTFQTQCGLNIDGIVGPVTRVWLGLG